MSFKNSISLVLGFHFVFLVISCNKGKISPTIFEIPSPREGGGGVPEPTDSVSSYIVLYLSQTQNAFNPNTSYQSVCFGEFRSNNGNRVNVGNILINGRGMSVDSNFYRLDYNTPTLMNEAAGLYGRSIQVSIPGGNDFPLIVKNIYVPKNIITTGLDYPYDRIYPNESITLNWSVETASINRTALIQVYYYSDLSRKADPALPKLISPLKYTVPDNGQFTIPVGDLSQFPRNGYVGITVARAVQLVHNFTGTMSGLSKKVYFYTVSEARTIPLKVNFSPRR